MRRVLALGIVAVAFFAAGNVRATPTSKLVYSRSVDAESCPDEHALRRAVAARIGYDPFFAWATRTVVASLTKRDQTFVATVDLVDENGLSHGGRELRAEGDCGDLLDAVALAIAIAIDPQSLSRPSTPAPQPPPEPAVAPRPAEDAKAPPTLPDVEPARPPPPRPRRLTVPAMSFEASAGAVASTGVAPEPAVGLALGAALGWRAFSLGLEGRIDAPASIAAPGGGEVSSWLLLGAVVPCASLGPVFGCAVMQAGAARSSGSGVPDARSEWLPWWAAGGRLGVLFAVSDDALLRLRTDVVADLDPMTLKLNGRDVWSTPPVAGSLGADVVLRFR